MQVKTWFCAAGLAATLGLAGCAGTGPNQKLGIGGGAVGGALLGNAIGGNTASTVGGAALGGLIGNEVGRSADERNRVRYPQGAGYYPSNGPHY